MNLETDKAIKQLEFVVKELELMEIVAILKPFIDRLAELTMDNRKHGRLLGWQIDAQKEEIKKLSRDSDMLKEQNEKKKQTIADQLKATEIKIQEMTAETKVRLTEATKKLREVEAYKEELEKSRFIKEAIGV